MGARVVVGDGPVVRRGQNFAGRRDQHGPDRTSWIAQARRASVSAASMQLWSKEGSILSVIWGSISGNKVLTAPPL